MNYIKHINQWLDLVSIDDRLSSYHVSIYMALFHSWNKNRFPDALFIYRNEIMHISKVGSTRTYYKCMHQLHEYGYIVYTPSKCPMKGSKVSITSLEDYSLDIDVDLDENEDENEGDISASSPPRTHVPDKQNRSISCSKNAPSDNLKVTPLLINNINLINYKQRERRTRTRNRLNTYFLKKQEEGVGLGNRVLSQGDLSEGTHQSKTVSCASSGNRLEIKKGVPRNFSIPTLTEIREFFQYQLSGKYSDGVLDEKTRLIEAEKFFNHYESNGWLLGGKVPMRNWKAACRSWAAKIPYFSKQASRSNFAVEERKNFHVERFDNYAEPL